VAASTAIAPASKTATAIKNSHFELAQLWQVVDNQTIKVFLNFSFHNQQGSQHRMIIKITQSKFFVNDDWKNASDIGHELVIEDHQTLQAKLKKAIAAGKQNQLVDLDDSFDNASLDWRNTSPLH